MLSVFSTSCDGQKSNKNNITKTTLNSSHESRNSNTDKNLSEIMIGHQIWMVKNLNVDKFRTGESILQAKSSLVWILAAQNKIPAWCYYNFNPTYGAKYGKLYNWYAVNDTRGIAPQNWHVPSDDEWGELIKFLGTGDDAIAGFKSKTDWFGNTNGTNSSGFSAFPSGSCSGTTKIKFQGIGEFAYWWTSSSTSVNSNPEEHDRAIFKNLYMYGNIGGEYAGFDTGFSVRCIKD